jgi:thiosulfate reductase / polysulfide reductase chain A
MKRREFIRVASVGVAGTAALGGVTTDWYGLYGNPTVDPGTDGDRVVPSFCELCFWKCGILAHVKDGRVTKIKGNPRDPLSQGQLCPRGAGGTGLLYDPDRLKRPMIRRDRRGSQEFQEVSWDDALDVVAENFEKIKANHGASALALFLHGYGGNWMRHLFRAYGSPNIAAPSYAQCRGPRDVGFNLTYGWGVGSPERTDIMHSRCLVLIGSHLGENMHNTQVQEFAEAVRRGATVITVDPRYSVAASKSSEWMPIKPGTDLALLLAWMHVILGEGLHDREYLAAYGYGFEQLQEHVKPYSPEWAYTRTGLDPDQIRRTARMMAAARPATLIHPGRHVTWYGNDTQRSRAIAILNALLGSWGGGEGSSFPPPWTSLPTSTPGTWRRAGCRRTSPTPATTPWRTRPWPRGSAKPPSRGCGKSPGSRPGWCTARTSPSPSPTPSRRPGPSRSWSSW